MGNNYIESNDIIVSVSALLVLSMLIFSLGASILWIGQIEKKNDEALTEKITVQEKKLSEFAEMYKNQSLSASGN